MAQELERRSNSLVTVVISTRNRGNSIIATIESICGNLYPHFELFIIDQSDNFETEKAVRPYLADPRVCYLHSNSVGLGAGRNEGIRNSSGELIAITDDDCEVSPDWLEQMVKAFKLNRKIGVVFGNVLAGYYEKSAGFIPTYVRNEPYLACSIREKNKVRGIGACMGVRRSVWQSVNGFDEMLGPGAPFSCNDDGDFAIKALLAGHYVYETPSINVVHHGFRTWKQGRALAFRNWYGVGAALAKHLKSGHFSILSVIWYEWVIVVLGRFLINLISQRKISGVTPVLAFARGMAAGLLTPVDYESGNYIDNKIYLHGYPAN